MKKTGICAIVAALALLSGCAQPMTKTEKGAAIGVGVGAATGALLGQVIGGDTKGTLVGAAIGATIGGVGGGAIGNYMDKQEEALRQSMARVEGASIKRDMDTLTVTFKSEVLFDVNSSSIKPGAYDELGRVSSVLSQYPQTTILIAGHTDSTGSDDYNQKLSEKRAESVKTALAGQGVAASRMTAVGFGESKPVADNATEAGRQANRRVVITIKPQAQ